MGSVKGGGTGRGRKDEEDDDGDWAGCGFCGCTTKRGCFSWVKRVGEARGTELVWRWARLWVDLLRGCASGLRWRYDPRRESRMGGLTLLARWSDLVRCGNAPGSDSEAWPEVVEEAVLPNVPAVPADAPDECVSDASAGKREDASVCFSRSASFSVSTESSSLGAPRRAGFLRADVEVVLGGARVSTGGRGGAGPREYTWTVPNADSSAAPLAIPIPAIPAEDCRCEICHPVLPLVTTGLRDARSVCRTAPLCWSPVANEYASLSITPPLASSTCAVAALLSDRNRSPNL